MIPRCKECQNAKMQDMNGMEGPTDGFANTQKQGITSAVLQIQ